MERIAKENLKRFGRVFRLNLSKVIAALENRFKKEGWLKANKPSFNHHHGFAVGGKCLSASLVRSGAR